MPTKIEWCHETWNPITGCNPISEGCKNCYAQRMAQRLKGRFGYPEDKPFRVTFHPEWIKHLYDQCQEAGVPFFDKTKKNWLAREFPNRKEYENEIPD